MKGLAIRLGIIGAIVIGAIVLRPYLTGSAGDLAVGDCFDEPETGTETVKDIQHRPCNELHDAEVVYVGNYEPASDTYPTQDQFDDFIADRCTGAFNVYTGLDYNATLDLGVKPFWPTSEGWGDGDREITCYLVKADGSQLNASLKKAS